MSKRRHHLINKRHFVTGLAQQGDEAVFAGQMQRSNSNEQIAFVDEGRGALLMTLLRLITSSVSQNS